MSDDKRRYSKVFRRMWNDAKFRRLSGPQANAQTLWLRLLTGPELTNIPGVFVGGEAALAEALGWDLEGFRKAFAEVFREGLVKADWKARLVWVPKAIHYNRPESPNVIRSWRTQWDELPECELKAEAYRHLKAFVEGLTEPFGRAFAEALPDPSPNQEQEQEQEQEQIPERHRAPASLQSESRRPDSEADVVAAAQGSIAVASPLAAAGPMTAVPYHVATLAAPRSQKAVTTQPRGTAPDLGLGGPVDLDQTMPSWAKLRYAALEMSAGLRLDVEFQWRRFVSHIAALREDGNVRRLSEPEWQKWLLNAPKFERDGKDKPAAPPIQYKPSPPVAPLPEWDGTFHPDLQKLLDENPDPNSPEGRKKAIQERLAKERDDEAKSRGDK